MTRKQQLFELLLESLTSINALRAEVSKLQKEIQEQQRLNNEALDMAIVELLEDCEVQE